jgi:hypothetical protein
MRGEQRLDGQHCDWAASRSDNGHPTRTTASSLDQLFSANARAASSLTTTSRRIKEVEV